MKTCNHLWFMPQAPENLEICCRTCGKKLFPIDVIKMTDWIEKARDLMVFNNLHDPEYSCCPVVDCNKFEKLIDEAPL